MQVKDLLGTDAAAAIQAMIQRRAGRAPGSSRQ